MSGPLFVLIIVAGTVAIFFLARDAWGDLKMLLDPRATLKARAERKLEDRDHYTEVAEKIDRAPAWKMALMQLSGLIGLLFFAWIIFR